MIKSVYKIVLPVNFSASCEKIIREISSFTMKDEYSIVALCVCENGVDEEKEQKRIELWLQQINKDIEGHIRKGDPVTEILSFSKEIDAAAIILNKNVAGTIDTHTIGEKTIGIIEASAIPVIILKTELHLSEINSILLPLDISGENKKKIGNAIFFSRFFNGALIRVMSAVFDADDFELNKKLYQLQHIVHFIEKSGCECVGEIMRCNSDEGDSISRSVVDYAERSEAEIVLLVTDDERSNAKRIHEQSLYMLANLRNNIITLTP